MDTEARDAGATPAQIMRSHTIKHEPQNGTGYAVCDCGATIRFEAGRPRGDWHACSLCTVHPCGAAAAPKGS